MDLAELQLDKIRGSPPERQKPVLLLADTMGQCIPLTDSMIKVVAKEDWSFALLLQEVIQGKINLSHPHIIVWVGARMTGSTPEDRVRQDLTALLDAIRARNDLAQVYVSAVLPQPKNQRSKGQLIVDMNRMIKTTIYELQQQHRKVYYLQTHKIYLDENKDIIRPIVENFEDGMHLNLHGAHRLRQFWLQKLGLSK